MKKQFRHWFISLVAILVFIFLSCLPAQCQSTTVSATVVDSAGVTWANGTWAIDFVPSPGSNVAYRNGILLTPGSLHFAGSLSSVGFFTTSVPSSNSITPSGSSYNVKVCPNATTNCTIIQGLTFSGASIDISSTITANTPAPVVNALPVARAYNDTEVAVSPSQAGYFYLNVTNNQPRYWNGAIWQAFATGLAGISSGNASPLFNTSVSTTAGTATISFSLSAAAANSVFGNCSTASASPTYCTLTNQMLPTTLTANTSGTAANVTGIVPVANGGTGTGTPSLVAGTNVTITGSFPNQTVNATGSGMVYPGAGMAVSTGSAWGTSKATPTGAVVGDTDTQTLTNKTLDGVTPATMGFVDPTSSIQTQLNAKAPLASPTFTGTPAVPTAAAADNSTTIASTAFVKNQSYVTATTAPVTSVFTRTGAVVAASGDYSVGQVTGAAPLASPTFTGTPAAPTPGASDNSTKLATTAFVNSVALIPSSSNISLMEDWLAGQQAVSGNLGSLGWAFNTIGTAATFSTATAAGHPGYQVITTSATSGTGSSMYTGANATLFLYNTINWTSLWIARVTDITNGQYRIGFTTTFSSTAIPTNGMYFRFLAGTDTNWMACMDNSSTETCTSTGIAAAANTWYDFGMSSTVSGTIVFAINGSTTNTINTNVPNTQLVPGVTVANTTATAVAANFDYFQFFQTGITR